MTENSPQSSAVEKPRRRWLQFSLRTLLLFVLACAIACSWFASKMDRAKRQQEAVAALRKFPGFVEYDYRYSLHRTEPAAPVWMRKALGDDFFADVELVCLGGGKRFTDDQMADVGRLANLKIARLGGVGITDAGLAHLRGLKRLEELNLGGTHLTDAGLEQLNGLTQLRTLGLRRTGISNDGLEHLKGLSRLHMLDLGDNKDIGNSGLASLAGLAQLEELDLDGTQVSDAGIEHLKGLEHLHVLTLAGTRVTPAGLAHLKTALPDCDISSQ